MGGECINHLLYADDLCLLAPSVQGLRQLLRVCELYGVEHDILFNPDKSNCMYFLPSRFDRTGDVFIGGLKLKCASEVVYLGHNISCNLYDEPDIDRQLKLFYCRSNQLCRKFKHCSYGVLKAQSLQSVLL